MKAWKMRKEEIIKNKEKTKIKIADIKPIKK